MRRSPLLAASLALLLAAVACDRLPLPPGPADVAGRFWAALEAGNLAAARDLSDASSPAQLRELAEQQPLHGAVAGEVLKNENRAMVETRAHRDRDRGGAQVVFHTHLEHFDQGWRVDVEATRRDVLRATLAATVGEVKETITDSAAIITESIEKSVLEFSEALRDALEELEDDLRGSTGPPTPAP